MAACKKIIETVDATDPHIETSDVEDASRATYLQCDRAAWIGGLVGVNEDNRHSQSHQEDPTILASSIAWADHW
jgi:hypothetical protein